MAVIAGIVTVAAMAVAGCGEGGWPFMTIRQADVTVNPEKAKQVVEINGRFPGSADEYWFGGGLHLARSEKDRARRAGILASLRPSLERAGIAFGMQQGVTLGHFPGLYEGDRPPEWYGDFAEDDYACGKNGAKVRYFCPRSPHVQEMEARLVELTARSLDPVSIWLDDDMRMAGWTVSLETQE